MKYELILVIFILILVAFMVRGRAEHYEMDQVARRYSDPSYMRWYGRVGDQLGNDMKEYYLQNNMLYTMGAQDNTFDNTMFSNRTDYESMPVEYRDASGSIRIGPDGVKVVK